MLLDFTPLRSPALEVGLALRIAENKRFLRITHLFKTSAYVISVRNSEDARYARRPVRILRVRLEEMAASPGSSLGTLSLPTPFLNPLPAASERGQYLVSAWELIEPLIELFKTEQNLERRKFSTAIQRRAESTGTNFTTIRRLVLRYYYFGYNKSALLPLPSGPTPAQCASTNTTTTGRRRGRQSLLASTLGPNRFIVSEQDVEDMMKCMKRLLRRRVTYLASAHEIYLGNEFRKRHPDEYERYAARQSVEPVTYRQFRYYVGDASAFDDDLAKNLRLKPGAEPRGVLRSIGPGEIYEIDATGGRIALFSQSNPPTLLGTPWIYILVDRWSRYIPAVYVTLNNPSYEEVRIVLLTSFTSRERFRFLGLEVNDERFPLGVFPAGLCTDRGSELISHSIQSALSDELRIDLIALPPGCPDAKAVVERLIRELKRRMTASRLKGVYADRPTDPDSKHGKQRAFKAATESIYDLYRILLEIVEDHNHRTHPALRRRPVLARHGVKPIPKDAYLWGATNITGLRRPTLSDQDIYRILLSTDYASLGSGVLRYRDRDYEPANSAATELCERSPRRRSRITIKIDESARYELFVPRLRGEWAQFRIAEGSAAEIAGITLDEEKALAPTGKLLAATADHEAKTTRVKRNSPGDDHSTSKRPGRVILDRKARRFAAAKETSALKQVLVGKGDESLDNVPRKPPTSERWRELAETERLRAVETARKRHGLL